MFIVFDRFKRVGPNAMRGRGIGTARGRATIMRGAFSIVIYAVKNADDHNLSTFS